MVLECREREHEEVNAVVEKYTGAQISKFLKGMRAQVRLLQILVNVLESDTEAFNIDGKPLRIEVEDIYFIIGFSRRDEVVNLKAWELGVVWT
jgi:hypothetical protein